MSATESLPAGPRSNGTGRDETAPYVGLSFYTEEDAPLFFGRGGERQVIMGNLRASRLTLLYAQSGVGKSSLLRAGVAARLRELARESLAGAGTAPDVPVVFSAWKDDPTQELIDEILAATNALLGEHHSQLDLPRDSLKSAIEVPVLALDQAVASTGSERAGSKLLIILDQFEEYFLYRARERRVERFADELAECINQPDLPANFLISIREDAYSALGDLLRGRITNVYSNYLHLDYLNEQAAREAIEGPIAYFNSSRPKNEWMTIEPGLVEAVLEQVKRDPEDPAINGEGPAPTPKTNRVEIATPYLQLVMTALWNRERSEGSSVLRLSTLQDLHGAASMVAQHLNDALGTLGTEDRELAVDVLHHLVTPSGTKVALEVADLSAYTRYPSTRVAEVLKDLAGPDRILREVPPAPGKGGDDDNSRRFEIYHDVLAGPINNAVAETATRRLEKEKAEAQARAVKEQKRARTFRAVAMASGVLLLAAIAAVVVALIARHHATQESQRAHQAELLSRSGEFAAQAQAAFLNGDLPRAVQLSVRAYRTRPTPDARSAVTDALEETRGMVAYLTGQAGQILGVAYSPDGTTLASSSIDGTVALWNASTGRREAVLKHDSGELTGVSFSPDGRLVAASDSTASTGNVVLWDARTHESLPELSGKQGTIETLAFAHTGNLLATAQVNGTVSLWNPQTRRLLRTIAAGSQPVLGIAFSPDGRILVTGSQDGDVIFWSTLNGHRLRTLHAGTPVSGVAVDQAGSTLAVAAGPVVALYAFDTGDVRRVLHPNFGPVTTIALSSDGRTLAAGSADNNGVPATVTTWDTGSGHLLKLINAPDLLSAVNSVAFSPDGSTLASAGTGPAGTDPSLIVWNAHPALGFRELRGPTGSVTSVAYSPTGKQIAATGAQGNVVIWNLPNGAARTLSLDARGQAVAFSPDGRTLAAATDDHTIILWDAASGRKLRVLRGHTDVVFTVAFSPNGKLLASGSADQKVIIWNLSTGRPARELAGHTDQVNAVAFSPNGRILASGGSDDLINLWDVATGRRLQVMRATRPVASVAFSSTGNVLASAGADEVVSLWKVATGQLVARPLAGHQDNITSLAFARNSDYLVSGSGDRTVLVWNLNTGLGMPIGGHTGGVSGVALSPDGRTVVSGGTDSTVTLATVPSELGADETQRLCRIIQRTC